MTRTKRQITITHTAKKLFSRIRSILLVACFATHASAQTPENENVSNLQTDIEFTEGMNQNLDSLLRHYHAKTYLGKEDDCETNDVNPVIETSVYIDRLSRMPTIIEMPYNEVVKTFIDRYTGRLRRSISYMLGASNFYMPLFEEALEVYQMPLELKYLPIIESALNPKAVSRAGATGLWQFMLTTGKDYGLEVNSLVDERCDPVRATYAAVRYLKDLYNIFGDWTLAIGAYNCGPENIVKAIRRAGGDRMPDGQIVGPKDYWKIYPYLPKETRGYVPAFIAANYAMNYYCEHNICPMRCELPVKTDTVMVNRNVHLSQIAEVLDIDLDLLKDLNPSYRRSIVPGATHPYPIRMLPADAARFIDMQDSIYNYRASELLPKRNVVELPVAATTSKGKSNAGNRQAKTVTVRKGDTLGAIARRNGTTVANLRRLNNIKGSNIRQGQRIRIR